tara:strand:+ start:1556 stop:3253 length:1698 start_codon:yes stop_codon:yes gene_type:complete
MSFWKSNIISADGKQVNQIPVEQTSQSVRSDNSREYEAGQVIRLDIPSTVGMINPEECYLSFDVLIQGTGADTTRLSLDPKIGAHSLIRDLKIYSLGDSNQLLEEITNYNHYVSIKYDYSSSDSKDGFNAIQNGAVFPDPLFNQDTDTSIYQYDNNNFATNPYYKSDLTADEKTEADNKTVYTPAKVNLKLESGLFQSMKALPVNLMQGLRLEITLEDNSKVFRNLSAVNPNVDKLKAKGLINGSAYTASTANASDYEYTLKNTNGNLNAGQVALVPGEKVNFFKHTDGTKGLTADAEIDVIKKDGTNIKIKMKADSTISASGITADGFSLYSVSADDAGFKPTYKVSNVDFYIQTLTTTSQQMASIEQGMKEGGTLVYDFLAVQNYKYSQVASDIVLNMRLPISNSRCKAILCQPTDATIYSTGARVNGNLTYQITANNYSVNPFEGIWDNAQDYQFYYEKLQPNRKIDVSKTKTAVQAQHLIELEKALDNAHIPVTSFKKFRDNFVIGRAFGVNENAVYDPRNKDFSVQVNYSSAPSKPHLWNNFVVHIKSIEISKDGVIVVN